MLLSKSKWEFLNTQSESVHPLSEDTTYSKAMIELLMQRGINTTEEANSFLLPKLGDLYNPEGLSMIAKASERIHKAISQGEKILVYGDYDADGVSSTTLMLKTLQELEANCDFYIPNRFSEGYGPNELAFKKIHERGFTVIITVDTGIASVHEALVAKELGIDLIITDHHELQDELPKAYALINPKCSPDYAFKDLAGVGVAFKLAESLLGYFPKHLLELVAIGTIADLVPLVNENRTLAYYGLQSLTKTENIGLMALKSVCGIEGKTTEEDVGFSLGPRLNAVGRLADASLAVDLLMSQDKLEAAEIAEEIELINKERKEIVRKTVEEAQSMVEIDDNSKGVTIVAKEGWNEGVLGIVASQLVRKYDQPAIVLTIKPDQGIIRGSARSIPAFNIFESGMKMRKLFTHFGGHSQAAGMTFPIENLAEIQGTFNQFINEQLDPEDFKQLITINKTVEISEINERLIEEVEKLAPFGMKNPKPIFNLNAIPTDVRQIGNLKNHLKIIFKESNHPLEGIGFGLGDLFHFITPHTVVSVVGEIGINEWNGVRKPQIVMRDIQIKEWQLYDHRGKKEIDRNLYIKKTDQALMIRNKKKENPNQNNLTQISYDEDIENLSKVDILFLYDLPPSLSKLKEIINATSPDNIHTCFYVEDSVYLTSFPSREEFKWFYSLVIKHKEIDLKTESKYIMKLKRWSEERTLFIANVFFELEFIRIKDDVIYLIENPNKKDLTESNLYQERIEQGEIEKELYYSNYDTLRTWFANCIKESVSTKEEVQHGL